MGFLDYLRTLLMNGWQSNLPNGVQFACTTVMAIVILLLLGFVFLVVLVNNRNERKLLSRLAVLVSGTGFVMYLTGYLSASETGLIQAIFHSIFSVIRMFIGEEDYGRLEAFPGSLPTRPWFIILFWATHVLALFLSSSIAITLFGRGLYQKLKLWFGFFHDRYHIIFGVTNQSLFYGESILQPRSAGQEIHPKASDLNPAVKEQTTGRNDDNGRSGGRPCVVYFASDVTQEDKDRIFRMGAVLHHKPLLDGGELNHKALRCMGFRSTWQKTPTSRMTALFKFLKTCWAYPRYKKYRFYLFEKDDELNLMVVRHILKYLAHACQVPVERVRILMLSENAGHFDLLQEIRTDRCLLGVHDMKLWPRRTSAGAPRDRSQGGIVGEIEEQLSKMIRCYEHPQATYRVSLFGESDIACAGLFRYRSVYSMLGLKEGKQTQPFSMMVLGGGEIGISALRRAIAQGQFESSGFPDDTPAFRAIVVDRDCDAVEARFRLYYPEAADHYHVEFIKDNVFGAKAMEKLKELGQSLKYIIVTLGDDRVNAKTARDLSVWFKREGKISPVIAVHIRDEERLMEKHAIINQLEGDDAEFVRFGAFRDVFSVRELFGERSRKRLISAVLLKNLYDTVYDARARVIEAMGSRMETLLWGEKSSAEAFLSEYRDVLNEEMVRLQQSFLNDLPAEPGKRKEWLKDKYRAFYDDTLFNQMSTIAAAENLEVYLNPDLNGMNYVNEHLRWNAFSRIHGWRTMSHEEFSERAGSRFIARLQNCLYRYIRASGDEERLSAVRELSGMKLEGKPFWKFRFQKDDKTMKHACITGWEELRQLDLNETMLRVDVYKTVTVVMGSFEGKDSSEDDRAVEAKRQESDILQEEIRNLNQALLRFLFDIPCYELYDKAFVDNARKIHDAVRELEKQSEAELNPAPSA